MLAAKCCAACSEEDGMSRVGKYPVSIPAGVELAIAGRTLTAKGKLGVMTPNLPLAVSVRPAIASSTPAGIETGYLPTRDMPSSSEHAAQHFAANIGSAGLGVAQHAAGRGENG